MVLPWHLAVVALLFQPPVCTEVCPLEGPGGLVVEWTQHVDQGIKDHKEFVVKNFCASACAIAIGYAIKKGAKVTVYSTATIQPHNPLAAVMFPMPVWYRKMLIDGKPFRMGTANGFGKAMFNY